MASSNKEKKQQSKQDVSKSKGSAAPPETESKLQKSPPESAAPDVSPEIPEDVNASQDAPPESTAPDASTSQDPPEGGEDSPEEGEDFHPDRILDANQVARKLSISPRSVYRLIHRKELPVARFGPVFGYRVFESDLRRYIERTYSAPAQDNE